MHERQRFGIALAGVGGCLCLAAGILITGSAGITPPLVADPPVALAERLSPRPLPEWPDTPRVSTVSIAPTDPNLPLDRPEPPRVHRAGPPTLVARQIAMPLLERHVPHAASTDVVVDQPRTRDRGAVTSAVVTAGTHVGRSFRTVGRTLRRAF